MKKKISIIIVTYNSEDHIFDCIDSIRKYNDIGNGLEVIVVDNNSTNVDIMFSAILKRFGSEIILIKNNKNGGYGQGNNVGVRKASAPIIMIMNPDVRLIEPVFNIVVASFDNPKVVMVGLQQNITLDKKGQSFLLIDNSIKSLFESKLYAFLNIFIQNKMCISGSCFFLRKSTFFEIGMFDENIFMYGEELDIHNRILMNNKSMKIIYNKSIKYIHLVSEREHTFNLEARQFESFIYLCNKYGLDLRRECKKRIKRYQFLRLRTLLRGQSVQVFDDSIEIFSKYLNSNLNDKLA